MMPLFPFIQQRNADRQLYVQLCYLWFQEALQIQLHSSHCRISSWAFIFLRCACNKVWMETALYYVEKKMGGWRGKQEKWCKHQKIIWNNKMLTLMKRRDGIQIYKTCHMVVLCLIREFIFKWMDDSHGKICSKCSSSVGEYCYNMHNVVLERTVWLCNKAVGFSGKKNLRYF